MACGLRAAGCGLRAAEPTNNELMRLHRPGGAAWLHIPTNPTPGQQTPKRGARTELGVRIPEKLVRLLTRHADPDEFECNLIDVEIGSEMSFRHRKPGGAGDESAPLALRHDDSIPNRSGPIVVFL